MSAQPQMNSTSHMLDDWLREYAERCRINTLEDCAEMQPYTDVQTIPGARARLTLDAWLRQFLDVCEMADEVPAWVMEAQIALHERISVLLARLAKLEFESLEE